MSGGSLNYFYSYLQDHDKDFGDKELDSLVSDLAELFHDREWYLSGDTGRGDWIEARDAFKEKWFTKHGRQERIEQYLTEAVSEIRDALGLDKRRCMNCKHWTGEERSSYGECDFAEGYLNHRSDRCEEHYEPREVET